MREVIVLVLVAAACGDRATPHLLPDGGDPGTDATPGYAACKDFGTTSFEVPAHVVGTLAGADVESPASCAVVDAPFGIESSGIDRVVTLTNLVPGAPYVVHLSAPSDLAFYVVSGCSTPTGPASDQCLLFEDATQDSDEVGRFIAPAPTAYVVVDYYATTGPTSTAFTLDVYPEKCEDDAQCGGATPACFRGQCVECETSFDCKDAARPRCDDTQRCQPGVDTCFYDGTAEPGDDGPAGAPLLEVDANGNASVQGSICSNPLFEDDYVAFDVLALGEVWSFQLAWPGGRDLDLEAYDAQGNALGASYYEQPERITLTYLAIGRYYIRVHEFASSADSSPVAYTLTATRTDGAPCASSADCAAEYRNQIYRGSCSAGACVSIAGNGAVSEGGACDSQSDCALALHCPSFYFVADADHRETCARGCDTDADCAPLGFVCTTYLSTNFCVAKCTRDDECPTALGAQPITPPWYRLTCDLPTGRCLP